MVSTTPELIIQNPTHLFVGPLSAARNAVVAMLQQMLCTRNACGYCATCQGIYTHSSAQLLWLEPENNYTREQIAPIFETLALRRAEKDYFFIVLSQAERLQHATANALLKSLEEPPQGYYFILMTAHERLVLPTIRSRSIVHPITADYDDLFRDNQLYKHFTGIAPLNPVLFLQALDQLDLSDQESADLFDAIVQNVQRALMTKKSKALQALHAQCIHTAHMLPQSGSSKIFWKNMYLKTMAYQ